MRKMTLRRILHCIPMVITLGRYIRLLEQVKELEERNKLLSRRLVNLNSNNCYYRKLYRNLKRS